jgi:hypothetical protein
MHRDSRKAQHNSFAHHRAVLLLSSRLAETSVPAATVHEGTERGVELREPVSAGILGFVRGAAQQGCAA